MANEIRTALVIDLEGNIETKTGELKKQLVDVGNQAKTTGGRIKNFATSSINGFKNITRQVFSLKGALAGLGVGAAIKSGLAEADKLHKLSIRLGESAENLSGARHIADMSGFGFDQLTQGWQRMARRISEAATDGSGEAVDALDRLQLKAEELTKLSPWEQFNRIADAMQGIADQNAKISLAQGLFDSEGVVLLQSMTDGAEGLKTMMQDAIDQGYILTQKQVEDAARANDAMGRIQNSISGLVQTFAVEMAPAIEKVATFLSENIPKAFEVARGALTEVIAFFMELPERFAEMADQVVENVKGMVTGVSEAFSGMVSDAKEYFSDLSGGIKSWFADKLPDWMVSPFEDAAEKVTEAGEKMTRDATGNSWVPDMIEGIRDWFGRLGDWMVTPMRDAGEEVTEIGKTTADSVAGFFEDMGRRIGSAFRDILSGTVSFKDGLKGLISDIGDMIQTRLVDAAVDGLANKLPAGVREFLGMGIGFGGAGSTTSAAPGALGSVKGPAVMNYTTGAYSGATAYTGGQGLAQAGGAWGQGAGAGGGAAASSAGSAWGAAAGAAIVAAIGVYGFGKQARKAAMRVRRQQEFFTQVGTETTEQLGESGFDYRGQLDAVTAFFSTARSGWHETTAALARAGLLTEAWGASLDENGRGLVKMQGDIGGIKTALEGAKVSGFSFATSLDVAIEKGNGMRVSLIGDFETIKAAMEKATASGIGGFHGLRETADGASAKVTGNLINWQNYFRTLVHDHINGAISGIHSLGSATDSLTGKFKTAAKAASEIRVSSSVRGGRSAQVDGGFAFGGVSRGPQLAWVSEGPYPVEAHIPMADGRNIPVRFSGPVPVGPGSADFSPVVAELRQTNQRLTRLEAAQGRTAAAAERTERRVIAGGGRR